MTDTTGPLAQLVMKNADGSSILSEDAGRMQTSGRGDLDPSRAAVITAKREELGFEVLSANQNTLAITGPDHLFAEQFGTSLAELQTDQTSLDAAKMSPDLQPFVADLFVPPAPQTFP